jgi:hypothetical protein
VNYVLYDKVKVEPTDASFKHAIEFVTQVSSTPSRAPSSSRSPAMHSTHCSPSLSLSRSLALQSARKVTPTGHFDAFVAVRLLSFSCAAHVASTASSRNLSAIPLVMVAVAVAVVAIARWEAEA